MAASKSAFEEAFSFLDNKYQGTKGAISSTVSSFSSDFSNWKKRQEEEERRRRKKTNRFLSDAKNYFNPEKAASGSNFWTAPSTQRLVRTRPIQDISRTRNALTQNIQDFSGMVKTGRRYFDPEQAATGPNLWTSRPGQDFAQVHKSAYELQDLPDKYTFAEDWASQAETPVGAFAKSVVGGIPQFVANAPFKFVRGISKTGFSLGEQMVELATPEEQEKMREMTVLQRMAYTLPRPKALSGAAEITEAIMAASIFANIVKGLLTKSSQALVPVVKSELHQLAPAKQTLLKAIIGGGKTGSKYGAFFGFLEGLEQEEDKENIIDQAMAALGYVPAGAVAGTILGATIAGTGYIGNAAFNRAMNSNAVKTAIFKPGAREGYLTPGQFRKVINENGGAFPELAKDGEAIAQLAERGGLDIRIMEVGVYPRAGARLVGTKPTVIYKIEFVPKVTKVGTVPKTAPSTQEAAAPPAPDVPTAPVAPAPAIVPSEVLATSFRKIIDPLIKKYGLSDYPVEEYSTFKISMSEDKKTGYSIKPDGDLISVFNTGEKGSGAYAVIDAIENGATKLDAFDGGLIEYYKQFGFREVSRLNWDDQYAPEDWDYDKKGRPDIVFMELDIEEHARYKRDKQIREQAEGARDVDIPRQAEPVFERNFRPVGQGPQGPGEGDVQATSEVKESPLEEVFRIERGPVTPEAEGLGIGAGIQMISPNVIPGMDVEQAIQEMTGERHIQMKEAFSDIDARLGIQSSVLDAIGDTKKWGTENSLFNVIPRVTNYEDIMLSTALKGTVAEQTAIIPFQITPEGTSRMYLTRIRKDDINAVRENLDIANLDYRTIIDQGNQYLIAVFDEHDTLNSNVDRFANLYSQYEGKTISPRSFRGTGEIIGADSPKAAAEVYKGRIREHSNWRDALQRFDGTSYGARISDILNEQTPEAYKIRVEEAPEKAPYNLDKNLVDKKLKTILNENEYVFLARDPGTIMTKDGVLAVGRQSGALIEAVEENGKVQDITVFHEGYHRLTRDLMDPKLHKAALKQKMKEDSISNEVEADEQLADMLLSWLEDGRTGVTGKIKAFFEWIYNQILGLMGKKNDIDALFQAMLFKKRARGIKTGQIALSYKDRGGVSVGGVHQPELTAKIIKTLVNEIKGGEAGVASLQHIEGIANRGGLREVERDLAKEVANRLAVKGKVNVAEFIKEFKKGLLPLQSITETEWGSVVLPEEVRGDVDSYVERIYTTPFKVPMSQHYGNTDSYFAHARIENMADFDTVPLSKQDKAKIELKEVKTDTGEPAWQVLRVGKTMYEGTDKSAAKNMLERLKATRVQVGGTRRLLETQSDFNQVPNVDFERQFVSPEGIVKLREMMSVAEDKASPGESRVPDVKTTIERAGLDKRNTNKIKSFIEDYNERIDYTLEKIDKLEKTYKQFKNPETRLLAKKTILFELQDKNVEHTYPDKTGFESYIENAGDVFRETNYREDMGYINQKLRSLTSGFITRPPNEADLEVINKYVDTADYQNKMANWLVNLRNLERQVDNLLSGGTHKNVSKEAINTQREIAQWLMSPIRAVERIQKAIKRLQIAVDERAAERGIGTVDVIPEEYVKDARKFKPDEGYTFAFNYGKRSNVFSSEQGVFDITLAEKYIDKVNPKPVQIPEKYLKTYVDLIGSVDVTRDVKTAPLDEPGIVIINTNPRTGEPMYNLIDGWNRAYSAIEQEKPFYAYPVPEEVTDLKVIFDRIKETQGVFPIMETDIAREARIRHEFEELVDVDAAQLKADIEEGRLSYGEKQPLDWEEGRMDKIRGLEAVDAHPEVSLTSKGFPEVNDGGHRIAVAAERGQGIEIAVPKDQLSKFYDMYKPIKRPPSTLSEEDQRNLDSLDHDLKREYDRVNSFKETNRFHKEILEALPAPSKDAKLMEKLLRPYKKIWFERILREEIYKAAVDGKTKIRFPTAETMAMIEGWVGPGIVPADAEEGDTFPYGEEEYLVISDMGNEVLAVNENSIQKRFDFDEAIDEEIHHELEDRVIYEFDRLSKDSIVEFELDDMIKKTLNSKELGQYKTDPVEYIKKNRGTLEEDLLEAIEDEVRERYPTAQDYVRYWADETGQGYASIKDDIILLKEGAYPEELSRGGEDFDEGELTSVQRTIYDRYKKDYPKFVKKLRPDTKRVVDEYQIAWWEFKVTPKDKERGVEAFRVEDKEAPPKVQESIENTEDFWLAMKGLKKFRGYKVDMYKPPKALPEGEMNLEVLAKYRGYYPIPPETFEQIAPEARERITHLNDIRAEFVHQIGNIADATKNYDFYTKRFGKLMYKKELASLKKDLKSLVKDIDKEIKQLQKQTVEVETPAPTNQDLALQALEKSRIAEPIKASAGSPPAEPPAELPPAAPPSEPGDPTEPEGFDEDAQKENMAAFRNKAKVDGLPPDLSARNDNDKFNTILSYMIGQHDVARIIATEIAEPLVDIPKEKGLEVIFAREEPEVSDDPEIAKYVNVIDSLYEQLYQVAKDVPEIDIGYLERYITHIWDLPTEKVTAAYKQWKTKFKYSNKRIVPTYKEGKAMGLKMKYEHPAPIVAQYATKLFQSVANIEAFKAMRDSGLLLPYKQARKIPGYMPVVAPGIRRSHTIDTLTGEKRTVAGDYYAPKSIATTLNKLFSPQEPTGLIEKGLHITAQISGALQDIGLSGGIPYTHLNAWTFGQLYREFFTNVGGLLSSPVYSLTRMSSLVGTTLKPLIPGASVKYFKNNVGQIKKMTARNIPLRTTYTIDDLMGKGFIDKFIADGPTKKDRIKGTWYKAIFDATFRKFVPALQISMFNQIESAALRKGYSPEIAADIGAAAVINFYGIIDSKNTALRSQIVQDALTTFFFAPRYRETMFRAWVNTLLAVLPFKVEGGKAKFNNPFSLENKTNTNLMIGTFFAIVAYNFLNYALTGRRLKENPPGTEDKLLIPLDDGYTLGLPLFPSTGTVVRYGYGFLKQAKEGDFEGMVDQGKNLLSFMVRPALDAVTNEDYFGRKIYADTDSPEIRWKKIALYLAQGYNHPWIGALVYQQGGWFLGKEFEKRPGYQNMLEALEAPTRFYKSDSLETRYYYENLKEMRETLSPSDQQVWDKLHTQGGYFFDIEDGLPVYDKRSAMANALDRLSHPAVLEAETEAAIKTTQEQGTPLSPFYSLSKDEQLTVLLLKTFYPGDPQYKEIKNANIDWLQPYWDKTRAWSQEMVRLGVFEDKSGDEITQSRKKEVLNLYLGGITDAETISILLNKGETEDEWTPEEVSKYITSSDFIQATPELQSKLDYYNTLPMGTGARTRYVNANPDVKAFFNALSERTNMSRMELGLPPLAGYGGYGSSWGDYQKKVSLRIPSYKTTMGAKIKAPNYDLSPIRTSALMSNVPKAPSFVSRSSFGQTPTLTRLTLPTAKMPDVISQLGR